MAAVMNEWLLTSPILVGQTQGVHGLLTSCSDAPPGHQPQSPGSTNIYSRHCYVFIPYFRDCIFLSARGHGCLYISLSTARVCNSKLDVPHPTSCRPHRLVFSLVRFSVPVCVSWPLASTDCHFYTVISPSCPSHLKPCRHSISSLPLFAS